MEPPTGSVTETKDRLADREALLRFQLDALKDEITQLKKERYELTYTASWELVRHLFWLEKKIVGTALKLASIVAAVLPKGERARAPTEAKEDASEAISDRVLVDLTGTVARDMGTGIERVVKQLSHALIQADPERCVPVRCLEGRLFECRVQKGGSILTTGQEIGIRRGDQFLILSDAWNHPADYADILNEIDRRSARIVVVIHDVIPEIYPAVCHEKTVALFRPWLRDVLARARGALCVSQSTARELAALVARERFPHRADLRIGWFHNASDFAPRPDAHARPHIERAVMGASRLFLCVGTLEPRKGHVIAIRAFERLWAQGETMRLVLVGKRGWCEHALVARIREHSEFGRLLFWFDDVDDAELSFLYAHMSALIYPSFAEGFGLPLIEAARFGKPAVCSDIPIFREIGRDGALYFHVNDPVALADCVLRWDAGLSKADPARVLGSSWSDAARRILDALVEDRWAGPLPHCDG
jgi:alpha-1,2-rhamnosyltransferase